MKDTLQEINALTEAGIIGQSAIGGAMAATFYLEPIATFDLDIFVLFENPPLILTLTPIYEFLQQRGHRAEGDAILIYQWPVQFLPAESPLLSEAVQEGTEVDYQGVPTRVMTAEHLMAIALQTGRAKDFSRIQAFLELGEPDLDKFREILERHQLLPAWRKFEQSYGNKP
jgi:hypothetical protein